MPVPRVVAPSLNVTKSGGMPVVLLMTVAVKVTEAPYVDGLADDATLVIVDAGVTVSVPFTKLKL
jgi:hypothetical protein